MQILINIPKEQYISLNPKSRNDVIEVVDDVLIIDAIKNGIPLPEHHSDLIERSSLNVDNLDCAYDSNFELDFGRLYTLDVVKMIEKAPTIIPATKEGE